MDKVRAIELNARRRNISLTDLNGKRYCLVGDGAYAVNLLKEIYDQSINPPECVFVSSLSKMSLSNSELVLDSDGSIIEYDYILLGTGEFQLEMIDRLIDRCKVNSVFLDALMFKSNEIGHEQGSDKILYIDTHPEEVIQKYTGNFLNFLRAKGYYVAIHHPLEQLSESYLASVKSVLVWNGARPNHIPMIDKIKSLKLPITYMECGFFPQEKYFYLDKSGVNSRSQLYDDSLDWVTVKEEEIIKYRNRYLRNKSDIGLSIENYILIPLQVPTDSNIVNHSRFKNGMQEYIDYILSLYPNENLIFKPHPKDVSSNLYDYGHGVFSNDDLSSLICGSSLVRGINSSVLYEAVLLGKDVVVDGDCLLKKHEHQKEKLLFAMIQRQFEIDSVDFESNKLLMFSNLENVI